jgi:SAM-dependent methyltransferase
MARIEENQKRWSAASNDWSQAGDEWSEAWGGPEAQWQGTIAPRIDAFLPARTILEIAPGYGRWTQFLKDRCERLIAVDLVEDCAEACRKRFSEAPHVEIHSNDGRSLGMVDDRSVDLAFSFDSLVHADLEVVRCYLRELSRVLSDEGVAFLHHSNLGEHRLYFAILDRIPERFRDDMIGRLELGRRHWRDPSVTAARVEAACREVGLSCIRQELVNWGGRKTIDCLTTLTRAGSSHSRANRVFTNRAFMDEARRVRLAAAKNSALGG